MKEASVIVGKVYALRSELGGEVTDTNGKSLAVLEAGTQLYLTAQESIWLVPDDCKVTKVNFKHAPAVLSLLSGGKSELPRGFQRLEFLESTGTQYIGTGVPNLRTTEIWLGLALRAPFLIDSRLFIGEYAGLSTLRQKWRTYKEYATPEEALPLSEDRYDYYCNGNTRTGLQAGGYFADGILTNTCTGEAYVDKFSIMANDPNVGFTALFARKESEYRQPLRCFYFRQKNAGEFVLDVIPALAPTGRPCMFDTVTRKPFYNSGTGEFIVGLTLRQARNFWHKLPTTGGALTISLPEDYEADAAVQASLARAAERGGVLTVQTYTPEGAAAAAASTWGFRRIWVRRREDENGGYVAADGSRWQVEWCVDVVGSSPEAEGYEPFRSREAAVAYWELVPWVDPEAEKELLTEPTNGQE